MSVLVIGLSHLTAPLDVLESVTLSGDDVAKTLDELTGAPCIDEALVLATCNRVEVYADVTMFHPAVAEISSVLARRAGTSVAELGRHLYVHYAAPAVQHIFRVSAGLDSMVVGESQILGQVRDAYAAAVANGAVGTVLHDLAQRSLHVGKRVHSETAIDHAGASVVSVALDRAGSLQQSSVAVVGAGAMGALAATTAMRRGAGSITVANRGAARAERLAAAVGGLPAGLEDLAAVVADADVLVSSTGAVGTVIDADLVGDRSARPLLVLDLAVPRDIDPAVGALPGVTLLDLASLRVIDGAVVDDSDVAAADAIVTGELDHYLAAQRQHAVTPTVTALRQRAGEVVAAEVARLEGRLPGMDDRTRTEVESAVRRAVEKLLHVPTVRVKELAAAPDGADYTAALRALFDLDPASAESVAAVRDDTTGSRAVGGASATRPTVPEWSS
ncbi:glutamyl-tRNA reductase [Jatrophihabitans sp. YIM 134969]